MFIENNDWLTVSQWINNMSSYDDMLPVYRIVVTLTCNSKDESYTDVYIMKFNESGLHHSWTLLYKKPQWHSCNIVILIEFIA